MTQRAVARSGLENHYCDSAQYEDDGVNYMVVHEWLQLEASALEKEKLTVNLEDDLVEGDAKEKEKLNTGAATHGLENHHYCDSAEHDEDDVDCMAA